MHVPLPVPGVGGDPLFDNLAAVLDAINERVGAELDDRDRLEIEKVTLTRDIP